MGACYNQRPMPTCVLICESCSKRHTFFLDATTVADVQNGQAVSKHCLVCRTMTDWAFATVDRRTGRDRRQESDRRQDLP